MQTKKSILETTLTLKTKTYENKNNFNDINSYYTWRHAK
jgi:hypothetical protein